MSGTKAELPPIVRAMLRPGFYPHRPARVRLVQTHASWVFLAADLVYKVKKPVDFGFLDFSSAAKRRRDCEREIALNRRLAPRVYLRVAPIYRHGEGFSLSPPGRIVEHAVVMRRFDEGRLLSALLRRRRATAADLRRVGRRIADFHARASPAAPRWRRVGALRETLRENFRQTIPFLGRTVREGDYLLVWDYNHDFLERRAALLAKRAREGRIRDGHGDLHAGHVWIGPREVLAVDCIEFSDRIRQCDVAGDVAFLYMDLLHHRRPDLAAALMEEYLRRSGDWEVRLLAPFYACYRAVVREKVESLLLGDPGVSAPAKRAATRRAAGYFRLARDLARRDARPRLFVVGEMPGSGKSTVGRALADRVGARLLVSDALRKELAGATPETPLPAAVGGGIYAPALTAMTYRELLVRAERELRAGHSVVLDATYRRARDRRRAAALARAVGGVFVAAECRCPAAVARRRLEGRTRAGSVSDAGWEVYRALRRGFEPFGPGAVRVDTTRPLEECLAAIATAAYPL